MIERKPLPLSADVNRNVDGVEVSDQNTILFDGYVDENGATVKRPGLEVFYDFATGLGSNLNGLFWWDNKQVVIAVVDGKTYSISYPGAVPTVTDLTGVILDISAKVSFATNGTYLFMANGGRIAYTDGGAATQWLGDADAPTQVTSVLVFDTYLLANNHNNIFYFSDVNDPLSWSALSFATATGNPDKIVALYSFQGDLYLLGSQTVEVWENDGTHPFIRVLGGTISTGCAAPNSVVNTENGLFWLDNKRRFASFAGRKIEHVSTPYDKVVQEFSTVSDCIAYRTDVSGRTFLIFHFPTAQRTLCYNASQDRWSEFGLWNSDLRAYENFLGKTSCHAEGWGVTLIGSRREGKIYKFSPTAYTDDGTNIRFFRQTGFINHGTRSLKRNHQLIFALKRGEGAASTNPKLVVRWQNDNEYIWSTEREIPLGAVGQSAITYRVFRTGTYNSRQYQISVTEPVPVSMVDGFEDVEVLR